jgi:4-hydroxybenzoate polyprenyltransferase
MDEKTKKMLIGFGVLAVALLVILKFLPAILGIAIRVAIVVALIAGGYWVYQNFLNKK